MVGSAIEPVGQVVGQIARPSSALVPSRRITIGELSFTRPRASMMPLATSSTRVMPPKMLMKIDFTFGSALMTSSAVAMTSALAPPPMSRKLAALTADLVDDVERAHRQAGAVGDDADDAVEADVLQALLLRQLLAGVDLGVVLVLLPLGVAEGRVVVEGDLGVERVHLAVGREDQRVDLGEVAVAFDVAAVERHQERAPPAPGPRGRGRPGPPTRGPPPR